MAEDTRGFGLVAVFIYSVIMLALCATIIRFAGSESRLTQRHRQFLAAKNCAESVAEYGFYQIRRAAESNNDFNIRNDLFLPGQPLAPTLPSATEFSDTGIITSGTNAPQLWVGYVNVVPKDGTTFFVDPQDPNNAADPLRGKYVFRRDVGVYSKATVTVDNARPITAHITETISVRGAPLFAHALFYNMDMELFPGANMHIYGPVHANGNIYVSAQGGATLSFHSIVTSSGNLFHAWKATQNGARGTGTETLGTSTINFYTPTGKAVSLLQGGVWKDSSMGQSTALGNNTALSIEAYQAGLQAAAKSSQDSFRTSSVESWNNNLMTQVHGIVNYTPVAVGSYKEDTNYSDGVDSSVNSGRLLIEPPLPTGAAGYDKSVEEQKYSANAGIYLTVNPTTGAITASSRKKNALGTAKALTIPAGNKLATWIPYTEKSTTTRTVVSSTKTGSNTYEVTSSVTTTENQYVAGVLSSGTPETSTSTSSSKTSIKSDTTVESSKSYVSGLYDQRRKAGINLVEIDMEALRAVVTEMQKPSGSRDKTEALGNFEASDWTGIVYVEVSGGASTKADGSTVSASSAALNTGVRLVNGKGQVPSYDATGQEKGLSVATNTALYVKGDYNADGNIVDDVSPTQYEANEKPAALIGDSFTVLSSNWSDSLSYSNVRQPTNVNTEIAAAVLAGLVPTYKDGVAKNSGGAHNFIRFLEQHNDKVAIRGSIVALFEARMNPGYFGGGYYNPPTRLWGFSKQFGEGTYPPGTPKVLSYRRLNFTSMTAEDWAAAVAGLR